MDLNKLDEFCKAILHKYPYINHGGCGVFAALLGQHLAWKGYDVRIRISDYDIDEGEVDKYDLNCLMEDYSWIDPGDMEDWFNVNVGFTHCLV